MKFIYQFVGGRYNGQEMTIQEAFSIADSFTPSRALERSMGLLVQREELDEQPVIEGYCGPMWDGTRYLGTDGMWYYEFQRGRFPAAVPAFVAGVIRYESPDVYEHLSR